MDASLTDFGKRSTCFKDLKGISPSHQNLANSLENPNHYKYSVWYKKLKGLRETFVI